MAGLFHEMAVRDARQARTRRARYRAVAARYSPPALVVDKPAYSAFFGSRLGQLLVERHVGTVVVSGAETDVCVLSTVLGAVDLGFRVVIVQDALCSSSDTGHDALMTMYRTRFHGQIDLVAPKNCSTCGVRNRAPRPRGTAAPAPALTRCSQTTRGSIHGGAGRSQGNAARQIAA